MGVNLGGGKRSYMVPSEVVFVLFVNQAGMGSEDRYCDRRDAGISQG